MVKGLGEIEWERCSKDVLYWMNNKAHPMPYVYTLDPRTMYYCNRCVEEEGDEAKEITWGRFQTKIHLEDTHDIKT